MHSTFQRPATAIYTDALRRARKRLCCRIGQLAQREDAEFIHGWNAVVAATEALFRQEETLMALYSEAGLAGYRDAAAHTLAALHHLSTQVECGETRAARVALGALA